jgi:glycosyltransferase involved in cell wall biosynthesis
VRIGFFTDSYLPATHGVEVSIETFRVNLEKAGHDVFVYAPAVPGYVDANQRVFRLKSIRVIDNPEMRMALPMVEDGSVRALTRVPLDIVHVHTPFTIGLLGKYIATHQHIPIIYTHHTHYPEYAKAYLKERVVLPFLARSLSAWFSNVSDAVIAPSPKIQTLLRAYGVHKPIYVLPTGIRLQQFRKTRARARRARALRMRLGIAPGSEVLIFVGRLGREKNIEFLIRAFAELRKMRRMVIFVLVGDGPIRDRLRALVTRLGLSEATIFTGPVAHAEMAGYYQAANLFVFSSLTDTQGIVVLEAIASGLPVVALRDRAFTSIVKNGRNGVLLQPGASPVRFAGRVAALLENQTQWRRFSAASVRIAQGFSEEEQARKLTRLYEKFAIRRGR